MPTYETNGTLTTSVKSFSEPQQPNRLDGVSYSLNGQSITVDVIGSPSTASEEVNTVSLGGGSGYDLSWSNAHSDFQLEITLSTNDTSQTPTFDAVSVSAYPPNAPSVSLSYVDDGQLDTTINADTSGAVINGYEVQMNRDGSGYVDPAGGPSSPSSAGTYSYGPSSDTAYGRQVGIDSSFQFRVRATNSAGSSNWTTSGTVYTTPVPPHNPSVSRPDGETVRIEYTVTSNAIVEDGGYYIIDFREDTGNGYGGWTRIADAGSGQVSGSQTTLGSRVAVEMSAGTTYGEGSSFTTDSRVQFRIRYEISAGGNYRQSENVYADYGNEGNVYFSDDFESGDLSAWTTTDMNASSGVKTSSWSEGLGDLGISGPDSGSNYLWLESGSDARVTLGDLTGETNVLVKAVVASGSLDTASEDNTIEFYDGSAWQTLQSYTHEYNQQGWVEVSALVPSSMLSTDNRLRLQAYDSGGSGDYFAIDRVVVSDVLHEYTTPAAPSGLQLTTDTQGEISYSFTDNFSFPSKSRLFAELDTDGDGARDVKSNGASGTFTGLLDGEQYQVQARNSPEQYRRGEFSTWWDVTTSWQTTTTILPAPGLDTLQPGDKSTLYAGWTDTSNNEVGVRVYYRQVGASSWTEFGDLSPNTAETVIDTLQGGTEYEVKVEHYTEHTSTESQILTERANYYYERNASISGSGAIQANRSGKSSTRSTEIFGSGSLSLSREIKMARAAALNGSGGIEVTRDVAKNRNLKISGTGSISTEAQFKETFPSELTNGLTWEYNQDRMGFESEWVQFEASDGHGTASFYFTGTLGKVDPISPTVIMDYDSNGNGEVDERSTPKKVKFPDEPVTFPMISGDDGYYRVLLKDLRPEDIISLVKFGPAHT